VGRLPRHLILLFSLSGVLGLAGCILFTDPINEAPVVTIDPPSEPVVSGSDSPVGIVGRATDDQDSEGSLGLYWKVFDNPKNQGCGWITTADWAGVPTAPPGDGAYYSFQPASPNTVCVCLRATDHNGASSFKCLALTPSNPPPVATIVDASIPSFGTGKTRPLCSQVHLSAAGLTIPPGDTPTFKWTMDYEGNDSSGKLTGCTGVTTDKAQHTCFSASAPGTYTVTLSIHDTFTSNGNPSTSDSVPVQFAVSVAPDAPACLQRTEPGISAGTILLSRSSDLGSSYQSRTFVVDSVDDDCQPYPRTSTSQTPAQLVWSIKDGTSASTQWAYPVTSSNSFVISQSMFPNARPGDTVKLRVEARDKPTQDAYDRDRNYQPCSGDPEVCVSSACVRWTTWTVQFQP